MLPVVNEWETISTFSSKASWRYQFNGKAVQKGNKKIRIIYETGNLACKRMDDPEAFLLFMRQMYSGDPMLLCCINGRVEGYLMNTDHKSPSRAKLIFSDVACETMQQDLNRFVLKMGLGKGK